MFVPINFGDRFATCLVYTNNSLNVDIANANNYCLLFCFVLIPVFRSKTPSKYLIKWRQRDQEQSTR